MGKFTEIASKNWIMLDYSQIGIYRQIISYEINPEYVYINGSALTYISKGIIVAKYHKKSCNIITRWPHEVENLKFVNFTDIRQQTIKQLKLKIAVYNGKVVLVEEENLIDKSNCIPALWKIYKEMYPHLECHKETLEIYGYPNSNIIKLPFQHCSDITYERFKKEVQPLIIKAGENLSKARQILNSTNEIVKNEIEILTI